jgi:hypothetical protein
MTTARQLPLLAVLFMVAARLPLLVLATAVVWTGVWALRGWKA